MTIIGNALKLFRKLPPAVAELIVDVIGEVLNSPSPADAARRALEAARAKALDEAIKRRAPKRPR
jgi:hypothetical protein